MGLYVIVQPGPVHPLRIQMALVWRDVTIKMRILVAIVSASGSTKERGAGAVIDLDNSPWHSQLHGEMQEHKKEGLLDNTGVFEP